MASFKNFFRLYVFLFFLTVTFHVSECLSKAICSDLFQNKKYGQFVRMPTDQVLKIIDQKVKKSIVIARGVAPREAYEALYSGQAENGRNRGLKYYGIKNVKVRPGFILNPDFIVPNYIHKYFLDHYINLDKTADFDRVSEEIWVNLEYYSSSGANLEYSVGQRNSLTNLMNGEPQGWVLIYEIDRDVVLDHHPESNVHSLVKSRVVDIPTSSNLIAILPQPKTDPHLIFSKTQDAFFFRTK